MTQDRRLRILGLVVLVVFGVAWARAAWLTTVSASDLRGKLSEGRQPITVPAPRGTVTDAKGVVLAISEMAAAVAAPPFLIGDKPATAAALAPLLDLPEDDLLRKISVPKGYVYLARRVPESTVKKIRALGIEGIELTPTTRRRYPQETVASQLLGFAGDDGQGLSGLELSLEKVLRGRDGKRLLVHGRGGSAGDPSRVVYVREERPSLPGRSVKLTIDAHVQNRAEEILAETGEAFGARRATAIVMRPSDGALLAMANWPRVDANRPGDAPLEARQLMGSGFSHEPGSTFKAFTIAAALEEREITPTTTFDVPPQIQVADQTIGEAHPRPGMRMTSSDILAQSSNVGTVMIGKKLGDVRFDRWMRAFGFGRPTGVELPQEERGFMLDVDDYSGSSMGNLPIGQGEMVTPLQLMAAYGAIANDGVRHAPTIIDSISGERVTRDKGKRVVSAGTARDVRAMLTRVTEAGGTAAELAINGYTIAGKTGTANKVEPGQQEYSKTKYTSSFIGMAPASRPRVIIAVIVDEPSKGGIYGAQVTGNAFKELTRWTLNYLRVPPG